MKNESRELGAAVIQRLRDLVGGLRASANHHHSEHYGLLRHTLEVTLKMLEEFEGSLIMEHLPDGTADCFRSSWNRPRWQYLSFLAGVCHDLGKLLDMDVRGGERRWSPLRETAEDTVFDQGSHSADELVDFAVWLLCHPVGCCFFYALLIE